MITSSNNAKVKQVVQWQTKAKERRKDHVFLAEGVRMCEEAPVKSVREVYLTEELEQKLRRNAQNGDTAFWDKLQQTGYETVSPEVFAKMADTQTPQGILTVLEQPSYDLTQLLEQPEPLFLILENLQDPGNLGTMIRTGEGAGITGVIMNQQTVDIFNPKTIRATMGSIFRVPFVYVPELSTVLTQMHERGIHTYAAHLKGQKYYDSFSFREPTAFLIGNEGNIHERIKARSVGFELRKNPQMKRALKNFKAVLDLRVNHGDTSEVQIKKIIGIIDRASLDITQLD